MYRDCIKQRAVESATHILRTDSTIRQTCLVFGVGKSTTHKDVTKRLREIDCVMAEEVQKVLDRHNAVKHLRGGEATKRKYQKTA